jgi:hypothetical protein
MAGDAGDMVVFGGMEGLSRVDFLLMSQLARFPFSCYNNIEAR